MPSRLRDILEDPDLLGPTVGETSPRLAVTNPASGEIIGYAATVDAERCAEAISIAALAWPQWRRLGPLVRAKALHAWADLIESHRPDLARIITFENGKPLQEAVDEVDYALSFIRWFAEEGRRLNGETLPSHRPGCRMITTREPIGVVGAITPWNWPLAMIVRKGAAALAAGCPFLVKPAPETPFSALALATLAERAGVPAGIFTVLVGDAEALGGALMQSDSVRAISFTGSTATGRALYGQCATTVKKLSLELGGQAPFIVCHDADLDAAVEGAIATKFEASGQNCIGLNTVFVHASIYETFCRRTASRAREITLGNGMLPGMTMGPLINEAAVMRCDALVRDALDKGARLLCGGTAPVSPGHFFSPTVICDVSSEMRVVREEIFGPILPIQAFDEIDPVITDVNRAQLGLGAYIYSDDLAHAWSIADRIEAGMIGVNTPGMTGPQIPFGGVKQSGLGREGSRHGIEEFTEIKYLCIGASLAERPSGLGNAL